MFTISLAAFSQGLMRAKSSVFSLKLRFWLLMMKDLIFWSYFEMNLAFYWMTDVSLLREPNCYYIWSYFWIRAWKSLSDYSGLLLLRLSCLISSQRW